MKKYTVKQFILLALVFIAGCKKNSNDNGNWTIFKIKKNIGITTSGILILMLIFESCVKVDEPHFDPNEIHIVCKTGGSSDYNFKKTGPIDAIRYGDSILRISTGYLSLSFDLHLVDSPIVAKDYILSAMGNTLFIDVTAIPIDDGYRAQSGKVAITQMDTIQHKVRGTFSGLFRSNTSSDEWLDVKDGDFYVDYTQY